jgi:two-component system, OmpR family, response regulator
MPTGGSPIGTRPRRILLVEDDEAMALAVRTMLREVGEVHWAASAEMADLMLAGGDWALAVIDIGLPGRSGIDFVRTVHDRAPSAATLILTGLPQLDNAIAAIRVGVDDFMTKPPTGAELVAKARELILIHEAAAQGEHRTSSGALDRRGAERR